jgi:hypothetical protein
MSTAAVLAVLEHAPAWPSRVWKVAVCLAERVDGTTSQAWPSVADLARRSQVDARHVRRALRELEAAGWITADRQKAPNGRDSATVYTWHPPVIVDLVERMGRGARVPGMGGTGARGEGGTGARGMGARVPASEGGTGAPRTITRTTRRTDIEPSTPSVSTTLPRHPQPVDNLDGWGDAQTCDAGHLTRHGWCRACRAAWPEVTTTHRRERAMP